MLLRARRRWVANCAIGEFSLSVTEITVAPLSDIKRSIFIVCFEYLGKLIAMQTSSLLILNAWSNASPVPAGSMRVTLS